MSRKRCQSCGRSKPLTAFFKRGDSTDGRTSSCKACRKIADRMRYEMKREEIIEQVKTYRRVNSVVLKAMRRGKYRRSSPQQRAGILASNKRWRDANRQKMADYCLNYVARKKGAACGGKVDRVSLHKKHNGKCHLCGKPVSLKTMELDHVVPLARGGKHSPRNLKPAHVRCNRMKGDKLLSELKGVFRGGA